MAKSSKVTGTSAGKPRPKAAPAQVSPARATRSSQTAPVRSIASTLVTGLRPEEQRALEQALAGKSALLTGSPRARDAAIFVTAARLSERPVLVASPLAEQLFEQARRSSGIDVVALGAFVSDAEAGAARKRFARGGPLLLVVEPAQLGDRELQKLVARVPFALLGIAAAHACSEHAHELSPAYLGLSEVRRALGATVLATCTRTSQRVVTQVAEAIGGGPDCVIAAAEPRLDLRAQVVRASERKSALFAAIQAHGLPGIVLTATPQESDSVFAELTARGVPTLRVHAGMAPSERSAALARFASEQERFVLVTQSPHGSPSGLAGSTESEVGLGSRAPRPDLAFVVHYQAPLSPEQHFEDLAWLPPGGHSLLLADSSDAALVQALLAQQRIKPAAIEAVAQALAVAPTERPIFSDTLALRAGTSRRSAERVLSALGERNLLVRDGGQISRAVAPEALAAEARLLAARFASLRLADTGRAEVIARYVTSRHDSGSGSAVSSGSVNAAAVRS